MHSNVGIQNKIKKKVKKYLTPCSKSWGIPLEA